MALLLVVVISFRYIFFVLIFEAVALLFSYLSTIFVQQSISRHLCLQRSRPTTIIPSSHLYQRPTPFHAVLSSHVLLLAQNSLRIVSYTSVFLCS